MNIIPFSGQDAAGEHNHALLIKGLGNGDVHAATLLFRQFHRSLCYFAGRLTGDTTAAEHIVDEVFLQCWNQRTQLTDVASLRFFLYDQTQQACLVHIKQWYSGAVAHEVWEEVWKDSSTYLLTELCKAEALRLISQQRQQASPRDDNPG